MVNAANCLLTRSFSLSTDRFARLCSTNSHDLSNMRAALNRESSNALSARCANPTPGRHPWEDDQRSLQLPLGLGGCALLLTLTALVALYLRRRKGSRQQQQQMHAHISAHQSQGAYRTMAYKNSPALLRWLLSHSPPLLPLSPARCVLLGVGHFLFCSFIRIDSYDIMAA